MHDLPAIPFVDFFWISEQIENLKRRVHALPEREMKHSVLVEFLSTLGEEEFVTVLFVVQRQAYGGDSKARELMQEIALEPSAISQLSYEFVKKAYQVCVEHNLVSVQRLFFVEPKRTNDRDKVFIQNRYLDLPLGVRKQAARTQERVLIDRLLHDRNWRVIELLLNNPRLVERDVVSIAARRPTPPELLEKIFKHPKWSGRYRVRKALACNPNTAYPLARQLLGTFLRQDLQECLSVGIFREQLAKEAEVLLLQQFPMRGKEKEDKSSTLLQEISALADQFCAELDVEIEESDELPTTVDCLTEDDEDIELSELFAQAERDLFTATLRPVGEDD